MILHLPRRLCASLHSINGFAGWTLQAPILQEKQAVSTGVKFGRTENKKDGRLTLDNTAQNHKEGNH